MVSISLHPMITALILAKCQVVSINVTFPLWRYGFVNDRFLQSEHLALCYSFHTFIISNNKICKMLGCSVALALFGLNAVPVFITVWLFLFVIFNKNSQFTN